jgi:hypothetical protein
MEPQNIIFAISIVMIVVIAWRALRRDCRRDGE